MWAVSDLNRWQCGERIQVQQWGKLNKPRLTGIFYGVVRQSSVLFIDNKDSVFFFFFFFFSFLYYTLCYITGIFYAVVRQSSVLFIDHKDSVFFFFFSFLYYTLCYITGIFYAVVRQISMLFIDNKDSVFRMYLHTEKTTQRSLSAMLQPQATAQEGMFMRNPQEAKQCRSKEAVVSGTVNF